MIIVEDIKTRIVPENIFEIKYKEINQSTHPIKIDHLYDEIRVLREQIIGENFINQNGVKVCIGMSKKVQDALGLPMRAFEEMNELNKKYRKHIDDLEIKIAKIKRMKFIERIKFLFIGIRNI